MKSLIAILLLSVSLNCLGQSNYSIADTSKSWSYVSGGYGAWAVVCCLHNYFIHFNGDTIVNGNRYLKVFQSTDSLYSDDEFMGLIYEDTISQEVYFRDPEGNEGLIYDFSISIGDTINIVNHCYNYERVLICNTMDSLIIDEQYKKRFSFSVDYMARNGQDTWIEDIGSMNGILYPGVTLDGGFREFLCYKYNDTLIYTNPIHQTCRKDAFYPYIVQEYYDTAYLYYPYEFRFQITDTTEIDNVSWYGWEIPQDFYLDQVNGILEGYPIQLGSFFCAITVTNWSFHTDKLLGYITVVNPTGINSTIIDDKIEIFPNPCREKVFVNTRLPKDIKLKITICDVRGQVISEQVRQSDSKNSLDCQSFQSGVYFIKIESLDGRFVTRKKVVKM